MQSLFLLFDAEACQCEVENTVKENYNQNENIAVIFRLVYRDDEAEALHQK